jgi:hypothetical protein
MANLTLYAEPLWISPYVFSSFVGLSEKGTTFDIIEVPISDRAGELLGVQRYSGA